MVDALTIHNSQFTIHNSSSSALLVILGPTGVGKTELSLHLCERVAGEVVSADSRQIYRGMDIGTAKATPAEQERVPHHLIDVRTPDQILTLAEYQQMAYAAIDDIQARGHVPLLVGGTALYVRAVVEGLRIPAVPPDAGLRAQLEADLAQGGLEALVARLKTLDPVTVSQIDTRNPRRVLRALEIVLLTGRSKAEQEGAQPPPYRILQIGLSRSREELYRRIDARVDAMIAGGLVEETARLLAAGYSPRLPAMSSLGYREISAYLAGQMTLEQAAERIKWETHRFVRHQSTWFRKFSAVQWFDLDHEAPEAVEQLALQWLTLSE